MNKPCKYCGAKRTNAGRLKHHGRYVGFACRTYYGANIEERSEQCKREELKQEIKAELASTEIDLARLEAEDAEKYLEKYGHLPLGLSSRAAACLEVLFHEKVEKAGKVNR